MFVDALAEILRKLDDFQYVDTGQGIVTFDGSWEREDLEKALAQVFQLRDVA